MKNEGNYPPRQRINWVFNEHHKRPLKQRSRYQDNKDYMSRIWAALGGKIALANETASNWRAVKRTWLVVF